MITIYIDKAVDWQNVFDITVHFLETLNSLKC